MGNPVGWFEIYVDDIQRAKKFYESVFQIRLTKLESPGIEMWGFPLNMTQPGTSGSIVHMPGFQRAETALLFILAVKIVQRRKKRTSQFGGQIEKTKFSIGQYGFITLGYDTENNMIGLHSLL